MTLGEFRKRTENLSDDIELKYYYGGGYHNIGAMDCLDENTISFSGGLYGEEPIMGSLRVQAFCKKK